MPTTILTAKAGFKRLAPLCADSIMARSAERAPTKRPQIRLQSVPSPPHSPEAATPRRSSMN
jgi:hypothetical protein